ncbi:MAG: hypothetical protein PUH21_08090 [Prevotellaceae bacterium]|nr:hypothetical protein [Prevotellaceae bacterium]MDY3855909.1 hypothetical protein [Bacteroidaceae bacterium]
MNRKAYTRPQMRGISIDPLCQTINYSDGTHADNMDSRRFGRHEESDTEFGSNPWPSNKE